MARDHVGGEDMGGVRVWVAQEVGEGDGGKRIVIAVEAGVYSHHFGLERRVIWSEVD